jgi:hypothetical protein
MLCWSAQARAQGCADLYQAIKTAAMYCGFDCDQQTIEPLQQAYERQCIVAVIPLTIFPDDPRSDRPISIAVRDRMAAGAIPACAAALQPRSTTAGLGPTCIGTK